MKDLEEALTGLGDLSGAAAAAGRRFVDEAAGIIDIAFATMDSPIGVLLLAATREGLIRIGFDNEGDVLGDLADRISPRILDHPVRLAEVRKELEEYFAGRRDRFDLPLDRALISGFRQRVLEETARIPFGSVSTYQDVAERAGQPKGARAAGQALGGNPIPVIIPCHRVLRTGGGLGGYAGGTERKQFLLRLEGAIL
jgi:methylated-DNA-[protein]-cysteine S-methyltransferase